MKNLIDLIESILDRKENQEDIIDLLREFQKVWDKHEREEDEFFTKLSGQVTNLPEKMFLKQHKELRGHWIVINKSIDPRNPDKFSVALDTDCRMLIDKFRKHFKEEEEIINKIFPSISVSGFWML